MKAICVPSAECDEVHEAKELFDVVSLLCAIFFGIPLGLVLLRIASGLGNSIDSAAYVQMRLETDIMYSLILAVFAFVPMIYTYVRYRRKMEFLK